MILPRAPRRPAPARRSRLPLAVLGLLAACATGREPEPLGAAQEPARPLEAASGPAAVAAPAPSALDFDSAPPELAALWAGPPPAELFPVLRVVDGDTLHVERNGATAKLRLLSVDTEEKLSGRSNVDPLKPETRFGQDTTEWAATFFERHATVDGRMHVGLRFPDGLEQLDVYGRLLCHVVLPDGADYNVALVALGKSPYFNKYGNSRIAHEAFQAAQARARELRLGIWDPATNRDAAPGEASVVRDYAELLPWWNLRAAAVDAFRAHQAADPAGWIAADEPQALAAAEARGESVHVFGAIDRWFDEDDGSLTLLLRSGARDGALRAKIDARDLPQFDRAALERCASEPFVQNYLVVDGRLGRDARGFELWLRDPEQLAIASPQAP